MEYVRVSLWVKVPPVRTYDPCIMIQIQSHALNFMGGLWLQVWILHQQVRERGSLGMVAARVAASLRLSVYNEVGARMLCVGTYEDP